ncbi:Uncharacterised protein [Ralstonia mannitolilytica]|uniref:hypothetical protein n=1 Tax=Ralstonia mannitolilytica TaxID=105219 RepID=UPI000DFDCDA7|nr:hypothetical protein [Ralstonia mannitolilytica]SUD94260.1 Uncharacterised protein [Ralstonia mannitolilytica]
MSKYDALDGMILKRVGTQPTPFHSMYAKHEIFVECSRINAEDGKDPDDAFRVLDRRLQALRKAGRIRSTTKGWISNDY